MPERIEIWEPQADEWDGVHVMIEYLKVFPGKGEGVEVSLVVNGKEHSFVDLMKKIMQDFSQAVQQRARDLINDKADDLLCKVQTLQRLVDDVESEVRCQARTLFPDARFE